jgi:hypothetical protein
VVFFLWHQALASLSLGRFGGLVGGPRAEFVRNSGGDRQPGDRSAPRLRHIMRIALQRPGIAPTALRHDLGGPHAGAQRMRCKPVPQPMRGDLRQQLGVSQQTLSLLAFGRDREPPAGGHRSVFHAAPGCLVFAAPAQHPAAPRIWQAARGQEQRSFTITQPAPLFEIFGDDEGGLRVQC